MKKIIKKSYFWISAILIIATIILLSIFSGKVVGNVKYVANDRYLEFNTKAKTAVLVLDNGSNEREYYHYNIEDNTIRLYEQSSSVEVATLKLKNKFHVQSAGGGVDYTADTAVSVFYTTISICSILAFLDVVFIIENIKNARRKTKQ